MKGDILQMNGKERQRKAIVAGVKNGHFTVKEAAEQMGVTARQARRILRRYERRGDEGLIHGHRGQRSNHRVDLKLKTLVLALYRTKYMGFGPTLAAEKITEEGHAIVSETLRLWLKAEGLWNERRKRSSHRKRRDRREQFGDLLQMDGSFHHWFGDDYPTACLMDLVDDATGITMALLDKEETTEAAMNLVKQWIECYGVPKAIYVDLKTVYVSPKTLKRDGDENEVTAAFTHFSQACTKLGIKIIKAYSPQAKGRVERKHAVFQDRFVKELQLKNIKTILEANALLKDNFLEHINKKFAKPPADSRDAHGDVKLFGDLQQIFCWEYTRHVHNDWTIHFEGKCYQLLKTTPLKVRPKQIILVRQHLDKGLSLWKGNHRCPYEEVNPTRKASPQVKKGHDPLLSSQIARENKHKTPWGRFNPAWLNPKKKIENKLTPVL